VLSPIVLQTFFPSQLHLTLTDTSGEIQFIWSTPSPTQTSYVRISEESIWNYFEGESFLFKDNQNIWYNHKVKAKLSPGQSYKYQVGCKLEGFSETFEFKTPPYESSKVLMFGDFSVTEKGRTAWNTISASYKRQEINGIIMLGDLAYDLFSQSSIKGDDFMDQIQSVVSHVPVMAVAGNHEYFDKYHNYLARFPMPNNGFFYTFTLGYVRYVALHTEAFFDESDQVQSMLEFLENTLNRTENDKNRYPWVVVFAHRPVYCLKGLSKYSCGKDSEIIKNQIEEILFKFEVDLYVNGHVHNYQRSNPVYRGKITEYFDFKANGYINPTAPVYITTGAIGSNHLNTKVFGVEENENIEFASDEFSFGVLNACNKTHLNWQQISADGERIVDEFWIFQLDN
jgi:predicted MPP superfamily phosphohydrolase